MLIAATAASFRETTRRKTEPLPEKGRVMLLRDCRAECAVDVKRQRRSYEFSRRQGALEAGLSLRVVRFVLWDVRAALVVSRWGGGVDEFRIVAGDDDGDFALDFLGAERGGQI